MADLTCPKCGSPDVAGHEISGLYDGVLYWACLACSHGWPRDFGSARRLSLESKEYANRHNALQRHQARRVRDGE